MPFPGSPRHRRGHADLALTGDIEGAESSAMRAQMLAALEGPQHHLTVDMRGVSSLSSQAIGVLISVSKRQQARGQRLTLICSKRSATARSLNRAGLSHTFRILSEPPDVRPRARS
jgi:anti-anti-sigma factor